MDKTVKACVEVHPPGRDVPAGVEALALDSTAYWPAGSQLTVAFAPGASTNLVARIMHAIAEWSAYANITFRYVRGWQGADIRVAFLQGQGSYSYIGTGCKQVPADQHTMNLGWLDDSTPDDEVRRVALHEFGHALGCLHEQQQPSAAIPWDEAAVYAFYGGPPNNWSPELIRSQILQRDNRPGIQHSGFDGTSIMEYPVPAALTGGRLEIGLNTDLSAEDRIFIGSVYPKATPPPVAPPTRPSPPPSPTDADDPGPAERAARNRRLLALINAKNAERGYPPSASLDDFFPGVADPAGDRLARHRRMLAQINARRAEKGLPPESLTDAFPEDAEILGTDDDAPPAIAPGGPATPPARPAPMPWWARVLTKIIGR